MYSVNISDNKNIIYNNKQEQNKSLLANGDVIQGEIIEFNDLNATIKFEDKIIETNKNNIVGSIGDLIDFEVTKNKDGIQLKQLSKNQSATRQQHKKVKYNNELLEKDNRATLGIEEKDILQEEVERRIEVANIKRKMKSDYNNLDDNIVKKLMAEGIDIGKVTLGFIESMEVELKQQDISKMENSHIKELLEKNNIDKSMFNKIATQFKNNGLSFEDKNIEAINNGLEKFDEIINNIENINVAYTIKDNKNVTINNLYTSKNVQNNFGTKLDMKDKIKEFLNKNNIEATEENINDSFYLLSNEIEINEENLNKVNFIKKDLESLKKQDLIKPFVQGLQQGVHPVNLDLMTIKNNSKELHKTNLNIINQIQDISDENIAYMQDEDIEFTLSNIVSNKNNEKNISLNETGLTAKRQLLEIQLKLNSEVSFSLSNKGIELDVMSLKNTLDEIKKIENSIYKNVMEKEGIEVTDKNLTAMAEVFDKVKSFDKITNNVYKKVLLGEIDFNIEEINKEILTNKMAKNYEENQTIVNPKFKDSFNKITDKIPSLLDSLNIESNDLNIKASSILIKNKMDVTQENIDEILLIDSKINKLNNELQPSIVAKMFKENISVITTNVDDILEYVEKYNEEYGTLNNKQENIVKNLIKLEKDKSVSEKELKAIKSVYRAINQGIKNDGVAIGTFINSERDLTIGNLLDSSKYINKTKGNKSYIDGAVEVETNYSYKKSIEKENIQNTTQNELNKNLLEEVVKESNLDFIKQLSNEEATIKSLFDENNYNEVNEEEVLENLDRIKNTNIEEVHNYLLEKNIPTTTYNMEITKEILDDNFTQTKKLKNALKKNEKIKEKLYDVSKDDLENTINENQVLKEITEELYNQDIDYEVKDLLLQQELIRSMKFQDEFNKSNPNEYELPVMLPLSSEATNLKMFMPNKNALKNNEIEVAFALSTEKLGNLEISADYNEKLSELKIKCSSSNIEALEKLYNDKNYLIDNLNKIGIKNISFEVI